MRCGGCQDAIPQLDKPVESHVLISKDRDGHIHTHGDLTQPAAMQELLDSAAGELGLRSAKPGEPPAEIIFHNRQRIGDMLMFTCAVRDFKTAFPKTRVNVIATAMHIFDHNPYLDSSLQPWYSEDLKARAKAAGKSPLDICTAADIPLHTNVLKIGPGRGTNQSNRIDWHFANAYRLSIEDQLKLTIQQGTSRPDIWLTQEEYASPRPFAQPYWVIVVSGEKGWGCKMYPFERWQKVVDLNPDLTFVQIGTRGDNPPRLQGPNVIDHVGKTEDKLTGVRDLFKLFLHAEGSMGLVSFHMHLSGALNKPAVVVAGAREPVSFTRYPGHAYLSTDGMLPCATSACWHCDIKSCTNLVNMAGESVTLPPEHPPYATHDVRPKCVQLIEPEDVSRALRGFYTGGRLVVGQPSPPPPFKNIVKLPKITVSDSKHIKIVSTARGWGGCARSLTTIMKLLLAKGHKVEFIPFRGAVTSREFQDCLKNGLAKVQVTPSLEAVRGACDALLVYADDFVWEFGKLTDFHDLKAKRKLMMLNYRRGGVGEIPWTRGWDRYCFLNSGQEKELLGVLPGVTTTVLPPCTDLEPFFAVQPTFTDGVRVVRHNSQGDTKFPTYAGQQIAEALVRHDLSLAMLPGPSFVPEQDRFRKVGRTADARKIAEFLASGNLFWYSLPDGYMDMGPRVILEAMAAGLPILADPWGGAVDRVTHECGWLLPKAEQINLLQTVTLEELATKGKAARERAKDFRPERWVELLTA